MNDYPTLIKELRSHICEITFRKADNSIRVLNGTRNPEVVPDTKTNKCIKNGDPIPVFDLDIGQWRSFRPDRLITIKRIL